METRHQKMEPGPAGLSQLPEFKRQNMLALLRRVKGTHEAGDWNEMVEGVKRLEARHPEALMDLEMRKIAWEIIEKLLKIKPGSESEAETEQRFEKITFLETTFPRIQVRSKKQGKQHFANDVNHPSPGV